MIPKWYQFGRALGILSTDMNIINFIVIMEDKGDSEVYMTSMLEEWKRTHEDSYTWETLQEALRVIGNNRLAAKLEEVRLKDKQGHYYNLEVQTPRYITWTLLINLSSITFTCSC